MIVRTNRPSTLLVVFVAAGMTALGACSSGKDAPKTPLAEFMAQPSRSAPVEAGVPDLPAAAHVPLDSGNALYRAKRYAEALAQYRLVAKLAPNDGAGYFGMYMIADVTRNRPLADSAMAALQARNMLPPSAPHVTPGGRSK